jgi:DNA-directed RNA polymerase subunit RPC12/RpoP
MQKYECKKCGAELYWNAEAGALKCEYCDSTFSVSDFEDKTLNENLVDESIDSSYTNEGSELSEDMVIYSCGNCGAEVVTSKTTIATICAYCGNPISISNKAAGDFRPDILIPFAIEKDKAKQIYKDYLKKSFLAPKEFSNEATINKIQGLYVPFWLYSTSANASAVYKCENVTSRKSGYDRVKTHKVYNVSLDVSGNFEKIPSDASKKLDNNLMDSLEPYPYKELKDFNPAYMSGFYAEQPDDDRNVVFPRVKERVKTALQQFSNNSVVGYDSKQLIDFNDNYKNTTSEYAMFPVWLLNISYKDKKHTFAVNGNTGKIVGKIPINYPKLIAICAGCFLGSQLLFTLFRFFM